VLVYNGLFLFFFPLAIKHPSFEHPPPPFFFLFTGFNGTPEQGINVGLMSGDLSYTALDSLGWNGAPWSFVDAEEASLTCVGTLTGSDLCLGLNFKISAHTMFDIFFIANIAALVPAILYTSWRVHELRLGRRVQLGPEARATLNTLGCVKGTSKIWLEPCVYLYLISTAFLMSSILGLPTYPISMDLMAEKYKTLGGVWWGAGQTTNGVKALITMSTAYDLFMSATFLLLPALYFGVQSRNSLRDLAYGGGVDATLDCSRRSTSCIYERVKDCWACKGRFSLCGGGGGGSGGGGGGGGNTEKGGLGATLPSHPSFDNPVRQKSKWKAQKFDGGGNTEKGEGGATLPSHPSFDNPVRQESKGKAQKFSGKIDDTHDPPPDNELLIHDFLSSGSGKASPTLHTHPDSLGSSASHESLPSFHWENDGGKWVRRSPISSGSSP